MKFGTQRTVNCLSDSIAHAESNANLHFYGSRFFAAVCQIFTKMFIYRLFWQKVVKHFLIYQTVSVKHVNKFDEVCAKMDMRLYLHNTTKVSDQTGYLL